MDGKAGEVYQAKRRGPHSPRHGITVGTAMGVSPDLPLNYYNEELSSVYMLCDRSISTHVAVVSDYEKGLLCVRVQPVAKCRIHEQLNIHWGPRKHSFIHLFVRWVPGTSLLLLWIEACSHG